MFIASGGCGEMRDGGLLLRGSFLSGGGDVWGEILLPLMCCKWSDVVHVMKKEVFLAFLLL